MLGGVREGGGLNDRGGSRVTVSGRSGVGHWGVGGVSNWCRSGVSYWSGGGVGGLYVGRSWGGGIGYRIGRGGDLKEKTTVVCVRACSVWWRRKCEVLVV